MNHAAQLAIIKQMNRHESCGPVGDYQAAEQARILRQLAIIKQMSRHESCGPAGDYQADEQA